MTHLRTSGPAVFRKAVLPLLGLLLLVPAKAQYSASEIASVQVSATVQASPARITLQWPAFPSATGYSVFRKLRAATTWGSAIGSPSGASTSFQDNTPALNTVYEYKVVRNAPQGTGYGYLCSGIEVQPTDYQGKMILLVDNTLAAGLSAEIAQLEADLKADGWVTIKHLVAPNATVTSVRNLVIGSYNTDPANVKCVYIIGHVPVPYSGNMAPDGHTDTHLGAWPCDGYYAELTSTWTDNTVNETSGWIDNRNIPGDGKFDQSDFPSSVELQIGRIDLGDMPAFATTHTQRLSAYLNKAHNFKVKGFTPQVRGIVYDDLQDVPTPLAGSGWMSIAPLVGAANLTEATPNQNVWLKDLVNNQSYLWTYGSGGGLIGNDNGVLMFNYLNKNAATADIVGGVQWGGVFNMCFGSYVGDWNNRNNVMRAVLNSGNALTHVFSGEPNYWFHTMGMGEHIGRAIRQSMNNGTIYTPQTGGEFATAPRCAMALLGDPSLKLFHIAPPSNLVVSNNGGNTSFSWSAAEGSPAGYHVYSFDATGVPVRLTTTPVAGTSFNSSVPYAAGSTHMVRAVKLETTHSGSYWNLSLGAVATAPVPSNVAVSARVFLEGAYDPFAGTMRDDLRSAGLLPLTEPFTALGFTQVAGGGSESTTAPVLAVTGNNAIVDWVRLELRASGNPATVVATRQALVQRDGDVVATDGTSPVTFNVGAGSYHVCVRHRNHLGAMTGAAIALSGTATSVAFSEPSTGLFGTNAMKTLGAVRGLWMGNAGGGNSLSYTGTSNDRDPIITRVGGSTPTNSVQGYFLEDCDLNGSVRYVGTGNDRDPLLVNVGSTTPNVVRAEQVP